MKTYYQNFSTPLGPFAVAVDDAGAVVATAFGQIASAGPTNSIWKQDLSATREARDQLESYFSGERTTFNLPLAPRGTPFQQRVWDALLQIPYGKTQSYGGLARAVGNPNASRAVGSANGANPICVIIPCHRVIASDGSLGGFGFGLPLKHKLLALEGIQIAECRLPIAD